MQQLAKATPTPITLISTRDCFVYNLHVKETVTNLGKGRENVIKKEFFFRPNELPENYRQVVGLPKDADVSDIETLRVGITTYENFYQNGDMKDMEEHIMETENKSSHSKWLLIFS